MIPAPRNFRAVVPLPPGHAGTPRVRGGGPLDDEAWRAKFAALVRNGFVMAGGGSGSEAASQHIGGDIIWPNPGHEMAAVARVLLRCYKENDRPILYWEGAGWFCYDGTRYMRFTSEEFEFLLYHFFGPLSYTKINPKTQQQTRVAFNPDSTFLRRCRETIRSQAIKKDLIHDSWLDGRKDLVIPLRNGLLRVEDRVLLDHTPLFFNTHCLPFDYDPNAARPRRWLRFLDEAWPDDPDSHALLQEWFGYVLSGRTDLQKMLLLIGVSRSGKGTIARILREMISAHAYIGLSSRDLAGDFGLAPLIGKTLAVFSDDRMTVRGTNVVENILRITGEDAVTANRKGIDHWLGSLTVRLMFMSNEVPTFPDAAQAVTNRILPLYMGVSWLGNEDPGLLDDLVLELPGIFNWSLDGLARLSANGGRFTDAASAHRVRELVQSGASPIAEFVGEMCFVGPDHWVSKDQLFERWHLWCIANRHEPGSKVHFARKLFAAYGTTIQEARRGGKGAQVLGYSGIGLQDDRHVYAAAGGSS